MKTTALAFFSFIALALSLFAGDFRTWTHLESGKTIQGKIIEKGDAKVQIETREGKTHWIELTKLIGADREHVAGWEKPSDKPQPITVEVLEKHETYQKITVTATTGDVPAVLIVRNFDPAMGDGQSCYERMKANSTKSWTGTVRNTYVVLLKDSEDFTLAKLSSDEVKSASR